MNCYTEIASFMQTHGIANEELLETDDDVFLEKLGFDELDFNAKELMPERIPEINGRKPNFPVDTHQDGNCLFRAVSRCIYGGDHFHEELRVKTVLEAISNLSYYSNEDLYCLDSLKATGRSHNFSVLEMYLLSGQRGAQVSLPRKRSKNRQQVISALVAEELFGIKDLKAYCGTLALFPLSSVIQRPISLIHPDQTPQGERIPWHSPQKQV